MTTRIHKLISQFIFFGVVFVNLYILLLNNFNSDNDIKIVPRPKSSDLSENNNKIDWHDYKFMLYESQRQGPGEQGKPVTLTEASDIALNKKGHKEEGFATIVSEKISPNRSLPDVRLEICKTKKYLKKLPKASVVIIFFNEPWSLLLRCLHSIYNRTPPQLLHEIIVMNDNSTNSELFYPLQSYIKEAFGDKVKLFVNAKRSGLIVTRVEGAKKASGEVIVFLDSHMEVNVNWLPPLLEPIAENPKTATVPILDSFSPFTLEYERLGHGTRGGFDWVMRYKWMPLRPQDTEHPGEPFQLPVMTGGAYAIRREYFFELGGYDEGLMVWNGENYEMSFKLWLCGGQLLVSPCSHVAHTSKLRVKYREQSYGVEDFAGRNLKRIAEVWLEDFKENVYLDYPTMRSIDAGDLSKALAIKERLHCKPIKYFFEEVAPEILQRYPPPLWGNFAKGAIISDADATKCITYQFQKYSDPLKMMQCSDNKTSPVWSQFFIFTWNRNIKYNDVNWQCLDAAKANLMDCHFNFGHQFWKYDDKTHQIVNPPTGKCITADLKTSFVGIDICNSTDVNQKFSWGYLNTSAIANWESFGIKLPK